MRHVAKGLVNYRVQGDPYRRVKTVVDITRTLNIPPTTWAAGQRVSPPAGGT